MCRIIWIGGGAGIRLRVPAALTARAWATEEGHAITLRNETDANRPRWVPVRAEWAEPVSGRQGRG